jgi:hypothetical protein
MAGGNSGRRTGAAPRLQNGAGMGKKKTSSSVRKAHPGLATRLPEVEDHRFVLLRK